MKKLLLLLALLLWAFLLPQDAKAGCPAGQFTMIQGQVQFIPAFNVQQSFGVNQFAFQQNLGFNSFSTPFIGNNLGFNPFLGFRVGGVNRNRVNVRVNNGVRVGIGVGTRGHR